MVFKNIVCGILFVISAYVNINRVDGSLTKIIVKIHRGLIPLVEETFHESNFSLYRKITDDIYVYATNSSDDVFEEDFTTDDLQSKLNGKVDFVYKSYDLFRPSPVAAEAVSTGSDGEVRTIFLQVGKDYKICSPVYDPMFGIDAAWQRNITGKNVVIAITDVGANLDHPKLKPNINNNLSWNFVDKNTNIAPEYYSSYKEYIPVTNHGNACAGLAAGIRDSSARCQPCGCGTAPDASLAILKVGKVPEHTKPGVGHHAIMNVETLCASLAHRINDIDIYSNSWNFDISFHNDKCVHGIMQKGYTEGRHGKGSIYVFPADPPGNGFVNNIYTLAIGNMGTNGTLSNNYQVNSAVLVCMFSCGTRKNDTRLVVDVHIELGSCSKEFGGQSATCAMAAGVIALALQVNPSLKVRDIRYIMVKSASTRDIAEESSFKTNAAGYKYHNVLGFGYPDGNKMISLAQNWTLLPPLRTDVIVFNMRGNNASFPVHSTCINKLEQVLINMTVSFSKRTQVSMEVISPHNTTSVLFYNITIPKNLTQLTLLSYHFFGETPNGDWMIKIYSLHETQSAIATVTSAQIQLHGTGTDFISNAENNDNCMQLVNDLNMPNVTRRADESTESPAKSSKNYYCEIIIPLVFIFACAVVVGIYCYKTRQTRGPQPDCHEEELKALNTTQR
ncbi:furin-like [Dreissena polymorpha]|uniref:P/Homo B domain-containing protein n=1 Tax=Dreissena polymorpha TaxID=45954 RepID=A0A9D4CYB3_DREPO|nr:furin-like [Dreissena polymorpha]KAH3735497.1 hypothetical protein DPMN_042030 [Dreissena polymorpha]